LSGTAFAFRWCAREAARSKAERRNRLLIALAGGFLVYGVIKRCLGLRLSQEQEYDGADLSIHKIGAVNHD
jgi:hypothetical protein